MNDEITITVVDDEGCPRCGHNGSPKVCDDNGVWHWKCQNRDCTVGYWVPETGEIEERPTLEEAAASAARIKAEVDAMFADRGPMVRLDDGSRPGIESWGWR